MTDTPVKLCSPDSGASSGLGSTRFAPQAPAGLGPSGDDPARDEDDLTRCDFCPAMISLEDAIPAGDGYICPVCWGKWRESFAACQHSWTPHDGEFGEAGQYCDRCMGWVADEDFPKLFPAQGTKARQGGDTAGGSVHAGPVPEGHAPGESDGPSGKYWEGR